MLSLMWKNELLIDEINLFMGAKFLITVSGIIQEKENL